MLIGTLQRWWREFWEGFAEGKQKGAELVVANGKNEKMEKLRNIVKMLKDEVS